MALGKKTGGRPKRFKTRLEYLKWWRENTVKGQETPAKRAAARATRAEEIDRLKSVPCTDCGNRFPSVCMDFDHVRDDKQFSIGTAVMSERKWETVLAEIDKCEVVCSNCHRIRTAQRAGWRGYEGY